jgi:hypothetical protein
MTSFSVDGSERLWRQNDRLAEPEAGEIGADGIVVADDNRGETRGIQVARHRARDLIGRQLFRGTNSAKYVSGRSYSASCVAARAI